MSRLKAVSFLFLVAFFLIGVVACSSGIATLLTIDESQIAVKETVDTSCLQSKVLGGTIPIGLFLGGFAGLLDSFENAHKVRTKWIIIPLLFLLYVIAGGFLGFFTGEAVTFCLGLWWLP